MKQKVPNAIYSKEFREQAVMQVTAEGLSQKEAARHLEVDCQ
jgi:transposase-like protein